MPHLLLLVLFLTFPISAYAEETQSKWEKDKIRIQNYAFTNRQKCDEAFNTLWNWSKKENLEARFELFNYMINPWGQFIVLPHISFNSITIERYWTIMAIHSIGSNYEEKYTRILDETFLKNKEIEQHHAFRRCLRENRSYKCVKILEDDHIIPTFDDFAKEIDILADAGYKPKCSGTREKKEKYNR